MKQNKNGRCFLFRFFSKQTMKHGDLLNDLPNPCNCETSLFSRTTHFTSKLISFSNFFLQRLLLRILVVQRWHILLLNFLDYYYFFSCDCAVKPEVRDLRTPNWNQPELSIPAADQKDRSSGNENGATLDCRCYGQHSHENDSRTDIRREPFIRAVLVLDKTCSHKWYSSSLI